MTSVEDVPGHGTSVDADRSGMVDCATYTGLHNALDSYQYLKIYTIWGGETLCSTTFLEHASLPLKAISSGIELLAEKGEGQRKARMLALAHQLYFATTSN